MVQTTWQDDDQKQVIEDVQQHGWHIVTVHDALRGRTFAHSIGLFHTLRQPEIIIFGLSNTRTTARIINAIGEEMKKGTQFTDWTESDRILADGCCLFRHVDRRSYRDYFGYAMWFYRHDDFPTLQCIWPDGEGRYPWQHGVSAEFRQQQPVLAEQQVWRFRQRKGCAVFTTKHVLDGSRTVLRVTHEEDGTWQFLCGTTVRFEDGRIASLASVLEKQPSLNVFAHLPLGWQGVRSGPDEPWLWTRIKQHACQADGTRDQRVLPADHRIG